MTPEEGARLLELRRENPVVFLNLPLCSRSSPITAIASRHRSECYAAQRDPVDGEVEFISLGSVCGDPETSEFCRGALDQGSSCFLSYPHYHTKRMI